MNEQLELLIESFIGNEYKKDVLNHIDKWYKSKLDDYRFIFPGTELNITDVNRIVKKLSLDKDEEIFPEKCLISCSIEGLMSIDITLSVKSKELEFYLLKWY